MESVSQQFSQLVLTIERLEGNPHLSPVVNGNGRLIKLFPAKLCCDIQKKFTSGVIICSCQPTVKPIRQNIRTAVLKYGPNEISKMSKMSLQHKLKTSFDLSATAKSVSLSHL